MQTIHTLSPILISKIAAGEVIERPEFAIKELVENALDANATEISIHLEDAGLTLIQVTDNGVGMSIEDVRECYKAHTTSKLSHEDQLQSIGSFGFRGEALSSLGSVSLLTIQSRQSGSKTGYAISVSDGNMTHESEVGMPVGTIVKAVSLFGNIPARKKFMKSVQTELRHCLNIVEQYALAHPRVQFTLSHGKKTLAFFPPAEQNLERIEQVMGSDITSFYIPVKGTDHYLTIHGFIAKPQMNTRTQQKQYLFVNARSVTDKLIATAVKESFGTMLESNTFPVFVLFISVPFELVDVNVHPRKEQVLFADGKFIFNAIKQLISATLSENNLTYEPLLWRKTGAGAASGFAGNLLRESVLDSEKYSTETIQSVRQFHSLYIVVTTKQTIRIYDQHAAHERILYEKLKKEFITQKGIGTSYMLPKPITLNFTRIEKSALQEYQSFFIDLGFKFKDLSITHVPFLFQDRDPKELIQIFWRNLKRLMKCLQSILSRKKCWHFWLAELL
jgi:DNA mismatch repair protein MutL